MMRPMVLRLRTGKKAYEVVQIAQVVEDQMISRLPFHLEKVG